MLVAIIALSLSVFVLLFLGIAVAVEWTNTRQRLVSVTREADSLHASLVAHIRELDDTRKEALELQRQRRAIDLDVDGMVRELAHLRAELAGRKFPELDQDFLAHIADAVSVGD